MCELVHYDWFFHNSVRFWQIISRNRHKNSWCTTPLQLKKTVSNTFTLELDVLLSVLALLDAFIGMIGLWFQCSNHTPVIRHQLWHFWTNLDFFLFPKLKPPMREKRFFTIEEIKEKSKQELLLTIPKIAFQKCFEDWKKRWH